MSYAYISSLNLIFIILISWSLLSINYDQNGQLSKGFVGVCICSRLIGFDVVSFGFECSLILIIIIFGSILNVHEKLIYRIFIVIFLFVIIFWLIFIVIFGNCCISFLFFYICLFIIYFVRIFHVICFMILYNFYLFTFFYSIMMIFMIYFYLFIQ